jgi:membrane protein YqaA with SNARE-associated domain
MLVLTTFGVCLAGAFIPIVNTEIYLLSVSAVSPAEFVIPLVVAATVGQMAGKVVMFYAGRGMLKIPNGKFQDRVLKMREQLEKRPWVAKATLFSSATTGLPPLYVMALVSGTVGMGIFSFITIGTVGRLIHFAVVAVFPQWAKILLG